MKRKSVLFLMAIIFLAPLFGGSAFAMSFDVGENTTIDCDVQLIYAAGIRVKDRSEYLLNHPDLSFWINGDDGNRNFDQWDMINNRFSTIIDVNLRHKNVGAFFRPKAFYDFVYNKSNANNNPATNNSFQPGYEAISKNDEFHPETEKAHGRKVELLDAFAYADFEVGNMYANFRVGDQVIQWGESLFVTSGIAGAQAPLDISAATTPGTELKEVVLPSGAVSLNVDLTDTLAIGGYYQYKWEHSVYFESGSYFSYYDMADEAGDVLIHPALPFGLALRGKDDEPSDSGQYGIKLMWRAPDSWLATEFGLYYISYHTKLAYNVEPYFDAASPVLFSYRALYAEDVKLYGASFSTNLKGVNVSGEISYQQDYPLELTTGWETGNFIQAQVSWMAKQAVRHFFDDVTIMGEVAVNKIVGTKESSLADSELSWGGTLQVSPSILNVLNGVNMSIPVTYAFRPNGTNSAFTEGAESVALGLNFDIGTNYKLSFKYVDYLNEKRNVYSDRDNLSCKFTYSF